MNAAVHDSLDQGSKVLVIHCALVLHEAAAVTSKDHCLILEVTLTTLVTDGAVQGVIDLWSKDKHMTGEMLKRHCQTLDTCRCEMVPMMHGV